MCLTVFILKVALWTVRSPLRLAVQPANCSRLVGQRRRMICHRALSLSSVQYNWGSMEWLGSWIGLGLCLYRYGCWRVCNFAL